MRGGGVCRTWVGEQLRSHKLWRAPRVSRLVREGRKCEVYDLDARVAGALVEEDDVLRLEVHVHDTLGGRGGGEGSEEGLEVHVHEALRVCGGGRPGQARPGMAWVRGMRGNEGERPVVIMQPLPAC